MGGLGAGGLVLGRRADRHPVAAAALRAPRARRRRHGGAHAAARRAGALGVPPRRRLRRAGARARHRRAAPPRRAGAGPVHDAHGRHAARGRARRRARRRSRPERPRVVAGRLHFMSRKPMMPVHRRKHQAVPAAQSQAPLCAFSNPLRSDRRNT